METKESSETKLLEINSLEDRIKYIIISIFKSFSLLTVLSGLFVYKTASNTTGHDPVATLEVIKAYSPLNILIINITNVSSVLVISILSLVLPAMLNKKAKELKDLLSSKLNGPLTALTKSGFKKLTHPHIKTAGTTNPKVRPPSKKEKYIPFGESLFVLITIIFYTSVTLGALQLLGNTIGDSYNVLNDYIFVIILVVFQFYFTISVVLFSPGQNITILIVVLFYIASALAPAAFLATNSKIHNTCVISYKKLDDYKPLIYSIEHKGIYLGDSGDSVTFLVKRELKKADGGKIETVWSKETINLTDNQMLIVTNCND
ncbi:hypothetical protein [Rothia nasimurium]|uniref:hypothetical protein n=1 Tax=Rothia nasimurium TaxID=85336 RepID=UPI001F35A7F0|nr:hypothetical protein [Rothia nasimurium]